MIQVKKEGILIKKTSNEFENEGVLNPAAILDKDYIHLFYRAVSKGNYSSIGYCKLISPTNVVERFNAPILAPEFEYESHGIEDPRIVKIDETYFLTYTAYDGINALGSLAISSDLKQFHKQGIIVPKISFQRFKQLTKDDAVLNEKYTRYNEQGQVTTKNGENVYMWDKNVIFFPRRIEGKLFFMHRIKPEIQIVCVNELKDLTNSFWENYFYQFNTNIMLKAKFAHEVSYIGGGCPPIETESGWLIIYHGVCDSLTGYVYSACASLMDLTNPQIEIARLPYPLFTPIEEWELKGEVNNVCFPTGSVIENDTLYIYYGAADEQIACASTNLSELIKELLLCKI